MTWRRFLVLVRGLSPQSASVTAAIARVEMGGDGTPVARMETPEQAQSAFVSLFKAPGGRV